MKSYNYLMETEASNDKENEIRQNIYTTEIVELQLRNSNILYEVAPVAEVPGDIVQAAIIQIGLGVAVLAISSLFPVSLVFGEPIAATFISEGIMDIVLCIQGIPIELNRGYYISKLIAHAVNVISIGIANIMSFLADTISQARTLAFRYFQKFKNLIPFIDRIGPVIDFITTHVNTCFSFLSDLEKRCRALVPRRMFNHHVAQTAYLTGNKIARSLLVNNVLSDVYVQQLQIYFQKMQPCLYYVVSKETMQKIEKINLEVSNIIVSKNYFDKLKTILEKWNIDFCKNYIDPIVRSVVVHCDFAPLIIFLQTSVETFIGRIKPFIEQLIKLIFDLIQQSQTTTAENHNDMHHITVDQINHQVVNYIMNSCSFSVTKFLSVQRNEFTNTLTEEEILSENDPYKILGLHPDEKCLEVVRKAYVKMSRKCRPNNSTINSNQSHVFNKISNAYEEIKRQIQES